MITHAAILYYNDNFPVMVTGKDYDDCKERADACQIIPNEYKDVIGFFTDRFIFLDKFSAKPEARKCGQLKVDNDSRELKPEDIW